MKYLKQMKKNIFLCLVMGLCTLVVTGCSKKSESGNETKKESVIETQEASETESIAETDETESGTKFEKVWGHKDIINILLIGQDRRTDDEIGRSDSMIIATLNRTEKSLTLTSLMRDTYLGIPGYGGNRLNAAYAFGGAELLDAAIEHNFGVTIDGNVEVDFLSFTKIVDDLGGVDIELTEEELAVLNGNIRDINYQTGEDEESHLVNSAGVYHLDGTQALAYARIRHVGNADFERTKRQRTVLKELFKNVKNLSVIEIMSTVNNVLSYAETDMSYGDLVSLTIEAISMAVTDIDTHNIPEDVGYESQSIDGMDVLVPDLDACRRFLSEITN